MTRQTVAVNVGRGGNAAAGRPVPQGLWKPDHDRTYSYSASGGAAAGMHAYLGAHLTAHKVAGMRAKNLLGLPWRLAFALQDNGWILRNAIVWHKPNAMPESIRDRLNCRYELIFLLVKQPAYRFDLDPIQVPHSAETQRPLLTRLSARGLRRPPGRLERGTRPPKYGPDARQVSVGRRYGNLAGSDSHRRAHPLGRNPGDVWALPTRPHNGPRFAGYPINLPLRCIAAGCKPAGTVLDPFTGTGTTGLAALQLGRRFTGIELSSQFAALAAERLTQAGNEYQGSGGQP